MVGEKLEALLETLVLDEAGETYAEMARGLAVTFDASRGSTNGSVVAAMAPLSKELRELVKSIVEGVTEADEFVADLFAEVGNSAVA